MRLSAIRPLGAWLVAGALGIGCASSHGPADVVAGDGALSACWRSSGVISLTIRVEMEDRCLLFDAWHVGGAEELEVSGFRLAELTCDESFMEALATGADSSVPVHDVIGEPSIHADDRLGFTVAGELSLIENVDSAPVRVAIVEQRVAPHYGCGVRM